MDFDYVWDEVGQEKACYIENEESHEEFLGSNELEVYDFLSRFKFVEFTVTIFMDHHLCYLKIVQLIIKFIKITADYFNLIQLVIIIELIINKIV